MAPDADASKDGLEGATIKKATSNKNIRAAIRPGLSILVALLYLLVGFDDQPQVGL